MASIIEKEKTRLINWALRRIEQQVCLDNGISDEDEDYLEKSQILIDSGKMPKGWYRLKKLNEVNL